MERGPDDRGDAPTEGGWLPPEPPGGGGASWSPPDRPDFGDPPGQGPPGRPPGEPPRQGPPARPPGEPPGHGPPGHAPGQGPPGQPPPTPAWGTPPTQQQSPYGQGQYGQSPYGGSPYGGYPYGQAPYGGPPSPYAATYGWQQAEPNNSPAVAGFVLSITSIGTLILFFGFLSPINFCVSIAGIFVSRNGIKKVERGETNRNKDLAKWGFWLGIVGAVLAALAIILFIAVIASDPNWLDELDDTEPR
jgi:hypothetical protein